jgi:hypothetical protein
LRVVFAEKFLAGCVFYKVAEGVCMYAVGKGAFQITKPDFEFTDF